MTGNRNTFNIDSTPRRTSTSSSTSSSSTRTTTTTTSTSTGGIHTDPGVYILTVEQWEELADYYERCIGSPMTQPMLEELRDLNEMNRIHYEVFRIAMRETAFARRPSWHYFFAILDRCVGDEIETIEDWHAAKTEYAAGMRKNWYHRSKVGEF